MSSTTTPAPEIDSLQLDQSPAVEEVQSPSHSPTHSPVQSPVHSPMQSPFKSNLTSPNKGAKSADPEVPKKPLKTPSFEAIKEKVVAKLNHKIQHRKNFSKLGVRDIAQWKNPVASAAIFLAGQMLFYMLWRWDLTLALVIGRVLVLQILICFAYFIGMKIIAPNREVTVPSHLNITPENVREYLEQIADKVYSVLAWYISVLLCKDFRVTFAFALAIEAFNRIIARKMTTMGLSYLGFNSFFILPILHEIFDEELQFAVTFVHDHIARILEFVQSKMNQLFSKSEAHEAKKQK